MEELSTEEKAKRYDEALEKIKKELQACGYTGCDTARQVFKFFPELKESEDERIRKEIIEMLRNWASVHYITKEQFSERMAWLERQGYMTQGKSALEAINEEKVDNANKIEPKFKVGDWIISKYTHLIKQISNNDNGCYETVEIDGTKRNDSYDFIECNFKLWTIQDARKGDVLVHNDITFIFMGFENGIVQAFEENLLNGKETCNFGEPDKDNGYSPATKEQRNTLEKAMADAGFIFDFEKKELKEIEDEEYDGEDYGIDSLWHAKNILEKTLGEVKGYQTDDGILSHKCAISFVDKLYKQKHAAWSEKVQPQS